MQSVRLEVERVYVVRLQGGVHMPEVSLRIKAGKKKPVSNWMVASIVSAGFWLFLMALGFYWRGYFDARMETFLSMLVWLLVYHILEEVRE